MTIYLISGSGRGAGKTTLAERLVGPNAVWSLAGIVRQELARKFPIYDWSDRTQAYKDHTYVPEYTSSKYTGPFKPLSLRNVLIDYAEEKCVNDLGYWAKKLVARLVVEPGLSVIAIDDVRKVRELNVLKAAFPNTWHFHVNFGGAVAEPNFDSEELEASADYIVTRKG